MPHIGVFNNGTTSTCCVTGRVVRLVGSMTGIVGGSPRVNSGLGIIFVPGCDIDLTRLVVPTTSLSRRVSLTKARTSNADGVGFTLGNTLAVNALSNTGIRVLSRINTSGVFVFNGATRRIRRLHHRNCGPHRCCRGSRRLRRILARVNDNMFDPRSPNHCHSLISSLVGFNSRCRMLTSCHDCISYRSGISRLCRLRRR